VRWYLIDCPDCGWRHDVYLDVADATAECPHCKTMHARVCLETLQTHQGGFRPLSDKEVERAERRRARFLDCPR
jgi:ribosomal protein S27E